MKDKFNIGDIVKSAKRRPIVYGVIIHRYFEWYKVFWFDEETQKENFDHQYPAYYIEKVS